MSQPTQDVSAAILDILIQAGNRKLSKEQSEELSKILKDNFGDEVSVLWKLNFRGGPFCFY